MALEVVLNLHDPNVLLPAAHPDSEDEPFAAFGDKYTATKYRTTTWTTTKQATTKQTMTKKETTTKQTATKYTAYDRHDRVHIEKLSRKGK